MLLLDLPDALLGLIEQHSFAAGSLFEVCKRWNEIVAIASIKTLLYVKDGRTASHATKLLLRYPMQVHVLSVWLADKVWLEDNAAHLRTEMALAMVQFITIALHMCHNLRTLQLEGDGWRLGDTLCHISTPQPWQGRALGLPGVGLQSIKMSCPQLLIADLTDTNLTDEALHDFLVAAPALRALTLAMCRNLHKPRIEHSSLLHLSLSTDRTNLEGVVVDGAHLLELCLDDFSGYSKYLSCGPHANYFPQLRQLTLHQVNECILWDCSDEDGEESGTCTLDVAKNLPRLEALTLGYAEDLHRPSRVEGGPCLTTLYLYLCGPNREQRGELQVSGEALQCVRLEGVWLGVRVSAPVLRSLSLWVSTDPTEPPCESVELDTPNLTCLTIDCTAFDPARLHVLSGMDSLQCINTEAASVCFVEPLARLLKASAYPRPTLTVQSVSVSSDACVACSRLEAVQPYAPQAVQCAACAQWEALEEDARRAAARDLPADPEPFFGLSLIPQHATQGGSWHVQAARRWLDTLSLPDWGCRDTSSLNGYLESPALSATDSLRKIATRRRHDFYEACTAAEAWPAPPGWLHAREEQLQKEGGGPSGLCMGLGALSLDEFVSDCESNA